MKLSREDGIVRSEVKQDKELIPIRLNEEERGMLNSAKVRLEQTKDGTCLKMLAKIGYIVLQDRKIEAILGTVFENRRKNKRIGVIDFE